MATKRKDGTWQARLRLGDGQRLSFYGRTRKEADAKKNAAQRAQEEGRLVTGPSQKVAEYLDRWVEERAKLRVRPTTYDSYVLNVDRLKSHIGTHRLSTLTHEHVQHAYAELLAGGLSARSVEQAHTVLRTAFHDAVKRGLLGRNPTDLATPPRPPQKETEYLTPEQVEHFLDATSDERLYPLWALLVTTGLRIGEALGLRWDDIDLNTGQLTVRQTLHRQRGKGLVLGEPKTQKSRRPVGLAPGTVEALKQHQTGQKLERLAAGAAWVENGLVFRTATGKPVDASTVGHTLHRSLQRAGLPSIRVHDLRHTAATYLLSLGRHPRVVQELLGHSTITLTMNTYSHVLPALHKEVAADMDRLFKPRAGAS